MYVCGFELCWIFDGMYVVKICMLDFVYEISRFCIWILNVCWFCSSWFCISRIFRLIAILKKKKNSNHGRFFPKKRPGFMDGFWGKPSMIHGRFLGKTVHDSWTVSQKNVHESWTVFPRNRP
jgi:hypothetical protein